MSDSVAEDYIHCYCACCYVWSISYCSD